MNIRKALSFYNHVIGRQFSHPAYIDLLAARLGGYQDDQKQIPLRIWLILFNMMTCNEKHDRATLNFSLIDKNNDGYIDFDDMCFYIQVVWNIGWLVDVKMLDQDDFPRTKTRVLTPQEYAATMMIHHAGTIETQVRWETFRNMAINLT